MKKRKSLFFKQDDLTEEQLLAEIDEFFCSLERTLINATAEDFAAAAKIFFAPIINKALKRVKTERHTIAESNLERMRNAQANRQKIRDIALKLPALKSKEKLAKEIQAALARRGTSVSTKTIKRALKK